MSEQKKEVEPIDRQVLTEHYVYITKNYYYYI